MSRRTLINRIASGLVTLAIVAFAFLNSFKLGVLSLLFHGGCCCLIWFGETIGEWKPGRLQGAFLLPARVSAGFFVAAMGWFFLLGLPILLLLVFKDFRGG